MHCVLLLLWSDREKNDIFFLDSDTREIKIIIFLIHIAIREDRTRGGRSTYQCSYTLPSNIQPMTGISAMTNPMTSSTRRQDDSPNRPQIFAISSNEATASQINESQDTVISEEEANSDVPSNVPALIQVSASAVCTLWK